MKEQTKTCPKCGYTMDLVDWQPVREVPPTKCWRCRQCVHRIVYTTETKQQ